MEYRTYIQTSYPAADVRSILGIIDQQHNKQWNEYLASLRQCCTLDLLANVNSARNKRKPYMKKK